jgi:hypothetical protein
LLFIFLFFHLWIKSNETSVLPNISDLEMEEKDIKVSSLQNQKRVIFVSFGGNQLKSGNLDLAYILK